MRLALFLLALMISPVWAQDEPAHVYGTWQVEPGNLKRAATIEFTRDEDLSYGFSCWKGHWLFFFNYQAPQGGQCEDVEECEHDVSEAKLIFQVPGEADIEDEFTLFENYYFQDENLSVADMEAMLKSGKFRLLLNDKLKTTWQAGALDFSLAGFEKAVGDNRKVFSCALHETVPLPVARPLLMAKADAKPGKAVPAKILKKQKHGKSKAARAKAAKSKLPSHAFKKSKAVKHAASKRQR